MHQVSRIMGFIICLFLISCKNTGNVRSYERNNCEDKTNEDRKKTALYFQKMIAKDSSDLQAYYNLGMSYYSTSKIDSALVVFNLLIEKSPCFSYALTNRAIIKHWLKDTSGACEDYEKAKLCGYWKDDPILMEEFKTTCN